MSKDFEYFLIASIVVSAIIQYFIIGASSPGKFIGGSFGVAMPLIGITGIIVFIPDGIYRSFKKQPLPGFTILLWSVWSVLVVLAAFFFAIASKS